MLVGGVVRNKIHDDADVAGFRFLHQMIEIGHGAVLRINRGVVGDVVAEVDLRRRIHRRDPDGVDAEIFQVVEALGDAVEVADAVAVRILKTARIDFVDDRVLPPHVVCTLHGLMNAASLGCVLRHGATGEFQRA